MQVRPDSKAFDTTRLELAGLLASGVKSRTGWGKVEGSGLPGPSGYQVPSLFDHSWPPPTRS